MKLAIEKSGFFTLNQEPQLPKQLLEEKLRETAIVILDINHKVIDCDEYFLQMFEIESKKQIIGKNLDERIACNLSISQKHTNLALSGKIISGDGLRRTYKNNFVYTRFTGIPISKKGETTKIFCTYQDITQETNMVAECKNAIKYSEVGILGYNFSKLKLEIDVLAAQNKTLEDYLSKHPQERQRLLEQIKLVNLNPKALEIFGTANKQEFLENINQIITPSIRADLVQKLLESSNSEHLSFSKDYKITTPKAEKQIHIKANIPEEHQYDWWRIFFNVSDITQRKKQEEIAKEKEKLEGVLQMAGAACHEINQPLQVILGNSSLANTDILEITSTIEEIKKETQRCTNNQSHKLQFLYEKLEKQLSSLRQGIEHINISSEEAGDITRKITNIEGVVTKPYLNRQIIDIEGSSKPNNES